MQKTPASTGRVAALVRTFCSDLKNTETYLLRTYCHKNPLTLDVLLVVAIWKGANYEKV